MDKKGKIMIPGMYDSVAPLTDEEQSLYEKIEFDLEEYCQDVGVKQLLHPSKASSRLSSIDCITEMFFFFFNPSLLLSSPLFFSISAGANLNAPLEVPISVSSWY